MKEQTINVLEKALIDIISNTTSGIEKGIVFLSTEIPEVIQQLLTWKAVDSFISLLCWMVLPLIVFLGSKKLNKFIKEEDINFRKEYTKHEHSEEKKEHEELVSIFSIVISFINGFGFVLTAIIFSANTLWIQILLAPKVYLIEYAAKLIK